jgi:hypothetical protein
MPTGGDPLPDGRTKRGRVLDPVERASEAIFGVLMAVSIMGALSVTTGGSQDARATLLMALGCNVAWGFTDALALAVLYGYGHVLGRYTGGEPWRYGLSFAALGAGLVAVIVALGG